jgi:hypothetical protein
MVAKAAKVKSKGQKKKTEPRRAIDKAGKAN